MKKLSPPYVFIVGSVVLLISTSLYYVLVPRFNYFDGGYTIYQPGSASPEVLRGNYSVPNVYLIFKYGEYLIMYLAGFVLVYFICSKIVRLKLSKNYVWMHLILMSIAFILLIYANPYIILPQNISGYLSDIYINGNYNEDRVLEGNKLILWYSSLRTPTSVIGIGLCFVGMMVFAVGAVRGMEYRR